MTVKELIEKLKEQDPETEVLLYLDLPEEHGVCTGVDVCSREDTESWKYDKAYHPFNSQYGWFSADKFVCIR